MRWERKKGRQREGERRKDGGRVVRKAREEKW